MSLRYSASSVQASPALARDTPLQPAGANAAGSSGSFFSDPVPACLHPSLRREVPGTEKDGLLHAHGSYRMEPNCRAVDKERDRQTPAIMKLPSW